MSLFRAATRKQSRLKMIIDGGPGAGKTHTMLRVMRGIGGKMAVIDTENGGVEKKSNELLAGVQVVTMTDTSADSYIRHIEAAESEGFEVLGIDSISHAWQNILDDVAKLAEAKYHGNTFRAWSEGTPMQRRFIDAFLYSKIHIIMTGRVKTEWVVERNQNDKAAPRKVGLAIEQGKGIEYEADILMRMSNDHRGHILKDRFDMGLQDKIVEKPGEELGKQLIDWLQNGEEPVANVQVDEIHKMGKEMGLNKVYIDARIKEWGAAKALEKIEEKYAVWKVGKVFPENEKEG